MCGFLGETFLRKRFPQTPSKTFLGCGSRFLWVVWEIRGKGGYSVEYG